MTTTGSTISVYRTSASGYRYYAGRWNQNSQQAGLEKDATRYFMTPIQAASLTDQLSATHNAEFIYTPYWM